MVLDGANALALPTKFGQSLVVETIEKPLIIWKSIDNKGVIWLDFTFEIDEILNIKNTSFLKNSHRIFNDDEMRLLSILEEAQKLNPKFLTFNSGFKITTKLDFPRDWGLGSSSTLINNIASWANVDAYTLLKNTFKGSGYDVAVAQNNHPILYSYINNKPLVEAINLKWNFTEKLFFVHLNKKQNSREAIKHYQLNKNNQSDIIQKIGFLTIRFTACSSLSKFEELIVEHENLISELIGQPPVKELLFKDYRGSIKSLGAWGGDFVLATGTEEDWEYFRKKGFHTIVSFREMIL